MYPRNSHALAITGLIGARVASWRGWVAGAVRSWIIRDCVYRVSWPLTPLAPHRLAFLRLDGPPATCQEARWDDEIATGFGFEDPSGHPHVIAKCGSLEQVLLAFLPDQSGVMIQRE